MSKVLIVNNEPHDWQRVYVDGKLVAENHPGHIQLRVLLKACGHEVHEESIPDFNMIEDE